MPKLYRVHLLNLLLNDKAPISQGPSVHKRSFSRRLNFCSERNCGCTSFGLRALQVALTNTRFCTPLGTSLHPPRTLSRLALTPSRCSVCVSPRTDRKNRHRPRRIVNAVDDAVGASPRTVAIGQWRHQLLAHSLRILQKWSHDEFVRSKCDRRGKPFCELTPRRRGNDEFVHLNVMHPSSGRA